MKKESNSTKPQVSFVNKLSGEEINKLKREMLSNANYIIVNGFLAAKYDFKEESYTTWNDIENRKPFNEYIEVLDTDYNLYFKDKKIVF